MSQKRSRALEWAITELIAVLRSKNMTDEQITGLMRVSAAQGAAGVRRRFTAREQPV